CVQLWPVIIRAALGLGERFEELERFGGAEPRQCCLLGLEAETAAALLLRRHADVSDCGLHRSLLRLNRSVLLVKRAVTSLWLKTIRCVVGKQKGPRGDGGKLFGRTWVSSGFT